MRRSCCGAQPRNAACFWPGAFAIAEVCHELTALQHRLQKHQSASRSSDTHTDVVSAMQVEAQLASVLRIGAA